MLPYALHLLLACSTPGACPPNDAPPPPPANVEAPEARPTDVEADTALAAEIGSVSQILGPKVFVGGHVGLFLDLPSRATRYRPSIRLSAFAATSFEPVIIDFGGEGDRPRRTSMVGGMGEVCPLGWTAKSSRRFDLVLSACAVTQIASVEREVAGTWVGVGPNGRLTMELGRRDRMRGVIDLAVGGLARVGERLPGALDDTNGSFLTTVSGGLVF